MHYQAQNQGKSGGDNISTQQQISPLENAENHAQKLESGGSGHSGGIIPSSIARPSDESNADLSKVHQPENVSYSSLPSKYVAFDFEWRSSSLSSEDEKQKQFPKNANILTNSFIFY